MSQTDISEIRLAHWRRPQLPAYLLLIVSLAGCVQDSNGTCGDGRCSYSVKQCSATGGQQGQNQRALTLLSTDSEIFQALTAPGTQFYRENSFSYPHVARSILVFSSTGGDFSGTVTERDERCTSYVTMGSSGGLCMEPCMHCAPGGLNRSAPFSLAGNILTTSLSGVSAEYLVIPGQSTRLMLLEDAGGSGFMEKRSTD
jgi:hypothetical protein